MARHTLLTGALLALSAITTVRAHIFMQQPKPYFATKLAGDKGPLPDGSSYPCRWPTWSQELNSEGNLPERTKLEVGAENTIKFEGTAVHDGGGCQLSITTDTMPSRDSVFKVFHTIEGGCPGMDSAVRDFAYTLPDSIPTGNATFVWTWFPVSSGAKEMYMNCAPVTVTGGADDDAEFSKLPDLFVANLANDDEFTCQTQDSRVVEFPDPGDLFLNQAVIAQGDLKGALAAPTDKNTGGKCSGKVGATTIETQDGQGGASTAAPASTALSTPAGGFIEASVAASSAPAAATPTTLLTASAPAATAAAGVAAAQPAVASPEAAAADSGTTTSGSSNGTCNSASSGDVVCNGTTQFGICNWGKVVWQEVAAGTICENGAIKASKQARAAVEIKEKRSHLHSHGRLAGRRSFRG